ncbi:MAG: hypothetical protein ACD_63C00192G0002, partial [uncultured bacterium]
KLGLTGGRIGRVPRICLSLIILICQAIIRKYRQVMSPSIEVRTQVEPLEKLYGFKRLWEILDIPILLGSTE